MDLTVLAFAHARETFGFASCIVTCDPGDTPRDVILRLAPRADLQHLAIARDSEYVPWDQPIGQARELAIIPPVSGG